MADTLGAMVERGERAALQHTHDDAFGPQVPASQSQAAVWSVSPCRLLDPLDMALEDVLEGCSAARARREQRCRWCSGQYRLSGACQAKATATPRHMVAPNQRAPIACSSWPRMAHVDMALEGVPEGCSGARARRDVFDHIIATNMRQMPAGGRWGSPSLPSGSMASALGQLAGSASWPA